LLRTRVRGDTARKRGARPSYKFKSSGLAQHTRLQHSLVSGSHAGSRLAVALVGARSTSGCSRRLHLDSTGSLVTLTHSMRICARPALRPVKTVAHGALVPWSKSSRYLAADAQAACGWSACCPLGARNIYDGAERDDAAPYGKRTGGQHDWSEELVPLEAITNACKGKPSAKGRLPRDQAFTAFSRAC
jgi:hypothetical protein